MADRPTDEKSSDLSERPPVRPASGPPDSDTGSSSDETAENEVGERQDRGPRPHRGSKESSEDNSPEISRKLQKWEAMIREAQKSVLEACRRKAWITETEAFRQRGYETASTYAEEVFGITRQRWYQHVHAGKVIEALENRKSSTAVDGGVPLPSNEAQTRPLHSHRDDREFLWKAWIMAVERHGDSPTRKDVKDIVEELTTDDDPNRTEDEGDTTSDEGEAADGPSDSAGPGDSESSSDGNSEGDDEEASATGDDPSEDSGETGSGSSGDVDDSNEGDGSSGGGDPGAGDCSDEDGSDTSGDRGVDGWVSVGDLAVRIPDESGEGHSLPAEPAKADIESLARAAEVKDTGLDRSSAERMIASRVWRVLSPSPHGIGTGLPEEETTEAALRPSRLGQITGVPPGADGERVLVCPGVDLFADVVPTGVVRAILARCRDTKHHPVVFTRHLGRAAEFDLSSLWIGTQAGGSRLEEAEQALIEVAPDAEVRWLFYEVGGDEKGEPPAFATDVDWVVYDPPAGAGTDLTLSEAEDLTQAAEEAGAAWAFRRSFETEGATYPTVS